MSRLAASAPPPQSDDETFVNTAGVGAGNRNPNDLAPAQPVSLSRAGTRRNPPPPINGNGNANGPANGFSSGPSPPATVSRPTDNFSPTKHELVVGEKTYRVDPSKDQQAHPRSPAPTSKVGDESDPMVQALANLRAPAGANVGRNGTRKATPADPSAAGASSTSAPSSNISPPRQNLDYRNSAELVVGVHPATQAPQSRSTSPVPPNANFMQPPSQASAPVVDSVIDSYHQSFPGERRSRPNSRRGSFNAPQRTATPPQTQGHSQGDLLERPIGHAGIGANGRSRSPSLSHPASPNIPSGPQRGGSVGRGDQGASQGQYRATTPNSVGIALDPHGNVAMDSMADVYRQQQVVQARQVQQTQAPPPVQPPPPAPVQYQQPPPQPQQFQSLQRQTSVNAPYGTPTTWQNPTSTPQPQSQQYASLPPAQQQIPQQSPTYVQAPHPYANAPLSQAYHAQPMNYGMQQAPPTQQQPQRQQTIHNATGSSGGDYYTSQQGYAPPQTQQQQQQRQQYQQPHQPIGYGSVSPGPMNRSPSPQPMALTQPQTQPVAEPPTRQYTEDGRGVLFYGASFFFPYRLGNADLCGNTVRALYDYTATIPEEFDFQANDIIAVTATPEDGWWSGELLDENRRVPGRHIFPSNFVHLF
jgi:SH3 domain